MIQVLMVERPHHFVAQDGVELRQVGREAGICVDRGLHRHLEPVIVAVSVRVAAHAPNTARFCSLRPFVAVVAVRSGERDDRRVRNAKPMAPR
jgi:hypothetical protein